MQNLVVTIIYYMLIIISIVGIVIIFYFFIGRKQKRFISFSYLIPLILLLISYTIIIKNNSIIWKEINNLKPLQNAGFKTSLIDSNIIKDEFLTMFKNWLNRSIFTPNIGVKIKSIENDTYAEIYSYGFDFDDDKGQYKNLKVIDILVPFKNGDIFIQRWKISR